MLSITALCLGRDRLFQIRWLSHDDDVCMVPSSAAANEPYVKSRKIREICNCMPLCSANLFMLQIGITVRNHLRQRSFTTRTVFLPSDASLRLKVPATPSMYNVVIPTEKKAAPEDESESQNWFNGRSCTATIVQMGVCHCFAVRSARLKI